MRKKLPQKLTLTAFFTILVFSVMFFSISVIWLIGLLLSYFKIVSINQSSELITFSIILIGISIVLATVISSVISQRVFGSIRNIEKATLQVAKGDFSTHLRTCGVWEIDQLSISFNHMVKELDGIETLRNDFINNFSHEFKTPIVSIQGFADLLQEEDITKEEQQEYLSIISSESKRLSGLLTAILNFSKIENTDIIREKKNFSLDEQLRHVFLLLRSKSDAKNITVTLELEDTSYSGSYSMLYHMWTNLLDNAIKYTNPNGQISISLYQQDKKAVIKVADNGQGMSEETRLHIFDKFYQGNTLHTRSGNGLGLTLVKRVVELCHGNIEVTSELGKGSTFCISIPM